jgi:acetyltransferase-like isoleucine patch superfamily enzyme
MIPGLSDTVEARLAAMLTPEVTAVGAEPDSGTEFFFYTGQDAESAAIGVEVTSGPEITLVVTDPAHPVGRVRIQTGGNGHLVYIDNRTANGSLHANIRLAGGDSAVIFNDIGPGYVGLGDVFLRSDGQFLFWGRGATAVACSVEIEGSGQGVVIGDDALISNGVWIRNHDMHPLHDLATGARIGRPPVSTVLERHVWLGQESLLLGCERIGMGSVVGARSLVKGRVPPRVAVAGTPARVLREGISWGRNMTGMTAAERRAVGLPARLDAQDS